MGVACTKTSVDILTTKEEDNNDVFERNTDVVASKQKHCRDRRLSSILTWIDSDNSLESITDYERSMLTDMWKYCTNTNEFFCENVLCRAIQVQPGLLELLKLLNNQSRQRANSRDSESSEQTCSSRKPSTGRHMII